MRCGESELGKEPQDQVDRGVEFRCGKARGLSWMSQVSGAPVSPLLRLLCQGPPWSALQPPSVPYTGTGNGSGCPRSSTAYVWNVGRYSPTPGTRHDQYFDG